MDKKQLIDDLMAQQKRLLEGAEWRALSDAAKERTLNKEEREKWVVLEQDLRELDERLDVLIREQKTENDAISWFEMRDVPAQADEWRNVDTGERAALSANESIQKHPVFERAAARHGAEPAAGQYGSLGAMIRAMATGGTGSAIVPTLWAGGLIDLARSESAIAKAQATIVPMEAGTVKLARQTGDPSAAFRAEGSALVASDPTFDNVTLSAKTLSALVVASEEWWQDAENAENVVVNALAKAMAAQIDMVALYGGITTGAGSINLPSPDPNPRGVLAAVNTLLAAHILGGSATDGTTPTVAAGYWNEVIDAIYTVKDANESPTGMVWSSKLARQYARQVDTTGQPLQIPAAVADVPRYEVNKIPTYTKGEMTTATDLFVGNFRQLLIGQRLGITIRPLDQLYAGTGQIGVVASWRGDVQVARPAAFAIYRSLKGAA